MDDAKAYGLIFRHQETGAIYLGIFPADGRIESFKSISDPQAHYADLEPDHFILVRVENDERGGETGVTVSDIGGLRMSTTIQQIIENGDLQEVTLAIWSDVVATGAFENPEDDASEPTVH